jgi:hypothetical protein
MFLVWELFWTGRGRTGGVGSEPIIRRHGVSMRMGLEMGIIEGDLN